MVTNCLCDYCDDIRHFVYYNPYNKSTIVLNLGKHYQYTTHNYDLMKKYYLMAIKHHNTFAMVALGYYSRNIEKNYINMKIYFLLYYKHSFMNSNLIINLIYTEYIANNYNTL